MQTDPNFDLKARMERSEGRDQNRRDGMRHFQSFLNALASHDSIDKEWLDVWGRRIRALINGEPVTF